MKKKVVIVDDHLLIAKAISSMVNEFINFEVLYEVENGLALQEKFKTNTVLPDIILLDISMPIMNGFDTALWLKENFPMILVMALSVQDDEESLLKMIQNGAKGFMHKNAHPMELENALGELVKNMIFFPSWANSKIYASLSNPSKSEGLINSDKLSDRELEFLKFVCLDLTYKEIGDKMCCSPRTVDGYRDSLFEKLNIHSRVGLALYAVKNGIHEI